MSPQKTYKTSWNWTWLPRVVGLHCGKLWKFNMRAFINWWQDLRCVDASTAFHLVINGGDCQWLELNFSILPSCNDHFYPNPPGWFFFHLQLVSIEVKENTAPRKINPFLFLFCKLQKGNRLPAKSVRLTTLRKTSLRMTHCVASLFKLLLETLVTVSQAKTPQRTGLRLQVFFLWIFFSNFICIIPTLSITRCFDPEDVCFKIRNLCSQQQNHNLRRVWWCKASGERHQTRKTMINTR